MSPLKSFEFATKKACVRPPEWSSLQAATFLLMYPHKMLGLQRPASVAVVFG
jgi:hypothetical protein